MLLINIYTKFYIVIEIAALTCCLVVIIFSQEEGVDYNVIINHHHYITLHYITLHYIHLTLTHRPHTPTDHNVDTDRELETPWTRDHLVRVYRCDGRARLRCWLSSGP